MEFDLTIHFDLDLVKSMDFKDEKEVYTSFLEDALRIIAHELRAKGVHPEVLEEAALKVKITPEKLRDVLYADGK